MKNVIFLGPPGCGKGTQADKLTSLGYIKVSTGDLLREIAKQSNELGYKVRDILKEGSLVSDKIVNQLITEFYSKTVNAAGIILDGYPRNVDQAKSLSKILSDNKKEIDVVFYFDVEEDLLVKRITGRYACTDCGTIYNEFYFDTKVANQCDNCSGHNFTKRSDDSEKVIINRLKIFKEFTEPLLEYYQDRLVKLDGKQEVELLSSKVQEALIG